jgi:hypothetical protein
MADAAIFRHGLEYPDNKGIPLSDIAATLLAQERLLPIVSEILEGALPGLHIEGIGASLDEMHQGSLTETFFIAILAVYQKDLEREVPELIQAITGVAVDARFDTIVTVLFMVALYAATKLLIDATKKPEANSAALTQELEVYVRLAATNMGVSPEVIEQIASRSASKRRLSAIRGAIDMFRPAKRGANGRILPLALPELSKTAVSEFPDAIALAELDAHTVPIPIPSGRLRIRAVDRDRSDRGWAGKLLYDGHVTRRLPIKLAPGLDPEEMAGSPEVDIEGLLEAQPQKDGTIKPVRIHVLRLTDQRGLT